MEKSYVKLIVVKSYVKLIVVKFYVKLIVVKSYVKLIVVKSYVKLIVVKFYVKLIVVKSYELMICYAYITTSTLKNRIKNLTVVIVCVVNLQLFSSLPYMHGCVHLLKILSCWHTVPFFSSDCQEYFGPFPCRKMHE